MPDPVVIEVERPDVVQVVIVDQTSSSVSSVNGEQGAVTVTPASIGAATTAALSAEQAARIAADANRILSSEKGSNGGVATLDGNGKVPSTQVPAIAIGEVFLVNSQAAMLALAAQSGDFAIRTEFDPDKWFVLRTNDPTVLGNWSEIQNPGGAGAISSVDGRTGVVSLADLYDPLGAAASKVADAVVNGVTAVAPSQNAVFDLMATEQTARSNGDATNAAAISTETTARINADSTEQTARINADNALSARITALEGGVFPGGVIQLDSYTGTDDQKLTAALAAVQAAPFASHKPAIQLPARDMTFSLTRVPFDGLKIIGPQGAEGAKSATAGDQVDHNHTITLNCGNGTSSWWNCSGITVFHLYFANLVIELTNGDEQMLHTGTTGLLYSCQFHAISTYGLHGVLGSFANACRGARIITSGDWSMHSGQDTQIHITGSDHFLWKWGTVNIESHNTAPAGVGRPMVWLDVIQKTHVANLYMTIKSDHQAMRVTCNSNHPSVGNFIDDCVIEGREDGSPTYAREPVLQIDGTGGAVDFSRLSVGNMDAAGGRLGVIEHGGGVHVSFYFVHYHRTAASGAAASLPLVYQLNGTTGTIRMERIIQATTSGLEQPTVRRPNNTLTLLALPADSLPT